MSNYEPIEINKWSELHSQSITLDGKGYVIASLHSQAKDLPVKEMPLECLDISNLEIGDMKVRNFAMHMKAVQEADLNFPIVLNRDGVVLDGRHRIVKALLQGETSIKFVRFKEALEPDIYLDREDEE